MFNLTHTKLSTLLILTVCGMCVIYELDKRLSVHTVSLVKIPQYYFYFITITWLKGSLQEYGRTRKCIWDYSFLNKIMNKRLTKSMQLILWIIHNFVLYIYNDWIQHPTHNRWRIYTMFNIYIHTSLRLHSTGLFSHNVNYYIMLVIKKTYIQELN